jgi:hypothetical protein
MKLVFLVPIISLLLSQNQFKTNSNQNDRGYKNHALRIEAAVKQGDITRKQADQRYRDLEERLRSSGKRGTRSNDISLHFKRLGINNLEKIKKNLLENGIKESQLEVVLGGMIRVVHAMKKDPHEFVLNSRIIQYFKDDCGLDSNQIDYIEKLSIQILP